MTLNFKKTFLIALFMTSLVIANVISSKIVQLGSFIVPGAFILYAITFLATDLISELYGKASAKMVVNVGFFVSLYAVGMIYLTKLMPVPIFGVDVSNAYDILLGNSWRIVLGSMIAYYVSQTLDVWLFHKIRVKTKGKYKWLRNNLSTMTSQMIDTVIFITIAFAGVIPGIGWMIISQYLVKIIVAAFDTPIFYLLTRNNKIILEE